jgi:beta-glucosidase
VKNKTIDEKTIDRNLVRILSLILKTPRFKGYAYSNNPDLKYHAQVSREAATEAMVLLKNSSNTLPMRNIHRVALFGKTAYSFITGGTGSGEVNYEYAASIKDAFINGGFKTVKPLEDLYTHFIDTAIANAKEKRKKRVIGYHAEMAISESEITAQVNNSDIAVIAIGRNAGEGGDRKETDYFKLSETETKLIKEVCVAYHAVGKKAIVVLNIGSVIETADWRGYPDAVLLAWQTGQEGANPIVDIMKGKVNPSGKLPMSFPITYGDVPSSKTFPGEPKDNPVNSFYNEGIYVGYRYYDTFKVPTAYEFGYGLSYTQFQYSAISLSSNTFSDSVTVRVSIKNTGKTEGKETAELYLSAPKTEIDKPEQELKAFAKTRLLKSGESQELTFTLNRRALASFWSGISSWVADKGTYEVGVGASLKDIRAKASFTLPESIVVEKVHSVLYPNMLIRDLSPNDGNGGK